MAVGKIVLLLLSLVSQPGPPTPVMAFLERESCLQFARDIAEELVDDDSSLECREVTITAEEEGKES